MRVTTRHFSLKSTSSHILKTNIFPRTSFFNHRKHFHYSPQMPRPKTINFVTGNKNKIAEVREILKDAPVEFQSQTIEDIPEIQGTMEEISIHKCKMAAEHIGGPVLTEDACLAFNAWNELPGPYVKWFLQAVGAEKFHLYLEGFQDKSAQAICTFAYSEGPGHEPIIFQGRTDGKIVPSRGHKNFGWDSCFEYEGETYAEMPSEKKNTISHRGKALAKLKDWLTSEDS